MSVNFISTVHTGKHCRMCCPATGISPTNQQNFCYKNKKEKSDSIIATAFVHISGIEILRRVSQKHLRSSPFVGLLTCMSRYLFSIQIPLHILRLLSCSPMTCFRRKRMYSILTATARSFIEIIAAMILQPCSGLSPDSLVQQNKITCLTHSGKVA